MVFGTDCFEEVAGNVQSAASLLKEKIDALIEGDDEWC